MSLPQKDFEVAKKAALERVFTPISTDCKFLGGRPLLHLPIGGQDGAADLSGGVLRCMTPTGTLYLDAFGAVWVPLKADSPALELDRYASYDFAVGFRTHTEAMAWFASEVTERGCANAYDKERIMEWTVVDGSEE